MFDIDMLKYKFLIFRLNIKQKLMQLEMELIY